MSRHPHDEPFTLFVTVPRGAVGDGDATAAVDPVLTARFGWPVYDVLAPRDHGELYREATSLFAQEQKGVDVTVVDAETGLLRCQKHDDQDALPEELFLRVVRLFPAAFLLGPSTQVVGEA